MNMKKILPIVAILIAIPMFIIGIFYKDRVKTVKKTKNSTENVLTQEEINSLQIKANNYDSMQEQLKQMATKICQRVGIKEDVEKVNFYTVVYYDTYEELSYTAITESYTIKFKGYDDDITITNNVVSSRESTSNNKSKEDVAKDLINKYDFLSDYNFIKLDDTDNEKNIAMYTTPNRDSNNNRRPDIFLEFDDKKEIMYNAQLKYEEVFCNNEIVITPEEAKEIAKEAVKDFATGSGDGYIATPEVKRVTPNNYFTRTESQKESKGNKDRNAYVVKVNYITVYVDATTGEIIGGKY